MTTRNVCQQTPDEEARACLACRTGADLDHHPSCPERPLEPAAWAW